ncbi:hypothetical protein BKA81DRAFT_427218 [Phyllosticta paracitricarpa]
MCICFVFGFICILFCWLWSSLSSCSSSSEPRPRSAQPDPGNDVGAMFPSVQFLSCRGYIPGHVDRYHQSLLNMKMKTKKTKLSRPCSRERYCPWLSVLAGGATWARSARRCRDGGPCGTERLGLAAWSRSRSRSRSMSMSASLHLNSKAPTTLPTTLY